jgi:hypothetical protein
MRKLNVNRKQKQRRKPVKGLRIVADTIGNSTKVYADGIDITQALGILRIDLGSLEVGSSITATMTCHVKELDLSLLPGNVAYNYEDDKIDNTSKDYITAYSIRRMRRPGLRKFIEDNNLPIDPEDYGSTAELKEAIIYEFFDDMEDPDDDMDEDPEDLTEYDI